MLFALSTGHQIGLATTGAVFIVFALISSFVLPSRYPNFPGRRRNLYLVVCAAFFGDAGRGARLRPRGEGEGRQRRHDDDTAAGDPAAGKAIFAANGCAACHTFKPAAATGKVGPDLDNLKAEAAGAGQPEDQFITTSVSDPNAYIAPGFAKPSAMPPLPLTPKQVSDLVAFLTS